MAAQDDPQQFRRTLDWGVNLGLMLGLPAAVALYLLAQPLIATLFMSFSGSAMTPHDVRMAGYALEMFAVALPGFVLVKILVPAFFAHQDTKSPLRYASGAVAANLVASLLTFRWFGHVGLAWATAVSAWVHVVLLYVGLNRRGLYCATAGLWPMFWKTSVSTVVLGLALFMVAGTVPWLSLTPLVRMGWVSLLVVAGAVLYLGLLALLGVRLRQLNHMSVS
jgi:putative peptidoglycan lipid II flippase